MRVFLLGLASAAGSFVNTSVERKVNVDRSYLYLDTEVAFKGEGSVYYHILPKSVEPYIAIVAAKTLMQDMKVKRLENPPKEFQGKDAIYYEIEVLKKGEKSHQLEIQEIYKRRLTPFPAEIGLFDDHLVRVEENKHFFSVYPTETERLTVAVEQGKLKKFEPADGGADKTIQKTQRSLKYGPYLNTPPFAFSKISFHFVHNEPMPLFKEARTEIVVSHWGNIAVDEYYILKNEAAKIKGQFSRADYYQTGAHAYSGGDTSIKSLHTEFPRHIHDLYYYDFIGNVSSSHAFRDEHAVTFDIEPRFHVFGGWNIDWHQGYSVRNKHNLFYNKLQ